MAALEVRDLSTNEIISTGILTEMGLLFSPSIPAELHAGLTEYLRSNPGKQSGKWEMSIDGRTYIVFFGSN